MQIGTISFFLVILLGVAVGSTVLVVLYHPAITKKAGPNWMWRLGRYDPIRNAFFRQDGSLRRYSRTILTAILIPGILFGLFLLGTAGWAILSASTQQQ